MTALHQPAALVPFTGASVAQPCASAWNAAMQKVEREDAASNAAIERYNRARAAYEAITGEDPSQIGTAIDPDVDRLTGYSGTGQLSDDAIDAFADATTDAILTPAPDLAALHWKMEHLFGETADAGAGTPAYCAEWGAALMSDARRLLATGRA